MKILNALAVVFFLVASQAWAQSRVRLKTRAAGTRPVRTAPRPERASHFLLEFPTEPGPELRRELERRGIRILQYVPDAALMVASRAAPNLEGLGRVVGRPAGAIRQDQPPAGRPGDGSAPGGVPPGCRDGRGPRRGARARVRGAGKPGTAARASGGLGSAQRHRRAGRVRRSGIHHARVRRPGGRDSAGRLRRSCHRGWPGGRVRAGEPRLAQGRRREVSR